MQDSVRQQNDPELDHDQTGVIAADEAHDTDQQQFVADVARQVLQACKHDVFGRAAAPLEMATAVNDEDDDGSLWRDGHRPTDRPMAKMVFLLEGMDNATMSKRPFYADPNARCAGGRISLTWVGQFQPAW